MESKALVARPEWLRITTSKKKDGSTLHLYKCRCGVEFLAVPSHIRRGKIVSCGCYRRAGGSKHRRGVSPGNALLDPTESSFNGLYLQYKHSASGKGLTFDLSKEQFRDIVLKNCHYCGSEPKKEHWQTKWARAPFVSNGIDRKDNSEGYNMGNSLPCCSECNYLKRDKGYDEFLQRINNIANNHNISRS